jgi:hypothetical protein
MPFRRVIAVGIASLLLWTQGARAEDRVPLAAAPGDPSLAERVPQPRIDAAADGYTIILITAGTVLSVIALNFFSRGTLTPILAVGTGTAMVNPATAATPILTRAATVVVIIAAHVTGLAPEVLFVAAVPALASVGGPVDTALRDGYTTPTMLFQAFEESASRAGSLIVTAGNYVGSAASSWLNGP